MPTSPATIAGLRELATYLEAHPEAELYGPMFNVFVDSREELSAIARQNKPIAKSYKGEWFCLVKTFSGGVTLEFNIKRDRVCRRVVTKEIVTRPKTVIIEGETETVEIEKVSWEGCDEPILVPSAENTLPE